MTPPFSLALGAPAFRFPIRSLLPALIGQVLLAFLLLLPLPGRAEPNATIPAEPPAATARATSSEPARKAAEARLRQAIAARDNKKPLADRLTALALRWERVERALTNAREREAEADSLEQKRVDADAQRSRAVTLVEQTEARRARSLARLKELGLELGPAPAGALK